MKNAALQVRKPSAIDALRDAVMALQDAHIETASLDARILLQHVMGISREQLLADHRLKLTSAQLAHYHDLIEKRKSHQPVAQLTGKREFWEHEFSVSEATLDPRPDSETLIEAVLERFADKAATLSILDLGTGTGCLLITLLTEYAAARGVGVDSSKAALAVAKENALRLQVADRAVFKESCWGEKVEGTFDIVISNPPYIPTETIGNLAPEVALFEPKLALDGGKDGLDCYRDIVAELPALMKPGGVAIFEIGMGQEKDLAEIAATAGCKVAGMKQDLSGITRCVILKFNN